MFCLQPVDLAGVDVGADDLVAGFREARADHEADIARFRRRRYSRLRAVRRPRSWPSARVAASVTTRAFVLDQVRS